MLDKAGKQSYDPPEFHQANVDTVNLQIKGDSIHVCKSQTKIVLCKFL